jgi:CBS domain-containing protein
MAKKIVPDIVNNQRIHAISPDATACEAAELMAAHGIGAVFVTNGSKLAGILTERDITNRLVAKCKDSKTTKVSELMTANPVTIGPDESARDALNLMRSKRFRHLPVVKDGHIIGMVSVRDLFDAALEMLENDLQSCEAFITGESYGVGN